MTDSASWPTVKRPLIAILRGIRPDEAESIVEALIDSGFELIEVPLNSPEPFASIERLSQRFGKDCLIGAGTVLSAADCARVADVGGRLMVAPNVDADVLATARARRMVTMPGVFTPTEALLAVRCGASALKFFPASVPHRSLDGRRALPRSLPSCRRTWSRAPSAACRRRTLPPMWRRGSGPLASAAASIVRE
jgi:2-dehydro-3-deoxyphosphogalactonate aldolase